MECDKEWEDAMSDELWQREKKEHIKSLVKRMNAGETVIDLANHCEAMMWWDEEILSELGVTTDKVNVKGQIQLTFLTSPNDTTYLYFGGVLYGPNSGVGV